MKSFVISSFHSFAVNVLGPLQFCQKTFSFILNHITDSSQFVINRFQYYCTFCSYYVSAFKGSFLWEDGVVLKRTRFCGTALSMDLPSSVISFRFCFEGRFWGRVQVSLTMVWFLWSGILSWCRGQFQVGVS